MKRLISTSSTRLVTIGKPTISKTPVVNITNEAAKRLRDIGSGSDILFSVKGGGCNGYNYNLELATTEKLDKFDETISIEPEGSESTNNLIVSNKSLLKVIGVEIDHTTDLMGSTFTFKNPNASSECGCGTSFNTKDDNLY